MEKMLWPILAVGSLCMILFANACNPNKTITATNTTTVTTSPTTAATGTIVTGTATINIANNAFQPSMMTARVGTTVNFYNMMGPITLVGSSGFMMGSFGGMMMQTGGGYQYTFNSPGVYVISASGQNFQCTITVIS